MQSYGIFESVEFLHEESFWSYYKKYGNFSFDITPKDKIPTEFRQVAKKLAESIKEVAGKSKVKGGPNDGQGVFEVLNTKDPVGKVEAADDKNRVYHFQLTPKIDLHAPFAMKHTKKAIEFAEKMFSAAGFKKQGGIWEGKLGHYWTIDNTDKNGDPCHFVAFMSVTNQAVAFSQYYIYLYCVTDEEENLAEIGGRTPTPSKEEEPKKEDKE